MFTDGWEREDCLCSLCKVGWLNSPQLYGSPDDSLSFDCPKEELIGVDVFTESMS